MMREFRRARRRAVPKPVPVYDLMTEQVIGRLGNLSESGMLLVATEPVVVYPPRTLRDTVRTAVRHYRGNRVVDEGSSPSSAAHGTSSASRTALRLVRSVRGPRAAAEAAVYLAATAAARVLARRPDHLSWERDESTRTTT